MAACRPWPERTWTGQLLTLDFTRVFLLAGPGLFNKASTVATKAIQGISTPKCLNSLGLAFSSTLQDSETHPLPPVATRSDPAGNPSPGYKQPATVQTIQQGELEGWAEMHIHTYLPELRWPSCTDTVQTHLSKTARSSQDATCPAAAVHVPQVTTSIVVLQDIIQLLHHQRSISVLAMCALGHTIGHLFSSCNSLVIPLY